MDLHVLARVAGDLEDLRRGVVRVAVWAKVMRLALSLIGDREVVRGLGDLLKCVPGVLVS